MKLKIVLHCYMIQYQRLTVLHNLLHDVTFHRLLIINYLLCYINDIVVGTRLADEFFTARRLTRAPEAAQKTDLRSSGATLRS
jgi:hypothetical protein